jgi:hypothetical protein
MCETYNEPMILFRLDRGQTTITTSTPADASLDAVLEDFRSFLLAIGYSPDTIDQYIHLEH